MTDYPKFSGKYASAGFTPRDTTDPFAPKTYQRETPHHPSRRTAGAVEVTYNKSMQYTGTACLGVAVMHKSNLVPVFSQDQAIDTAKMRRG